MKRSKNVALVLSCSLILAGVTTGCDVQSDELADNDGPMVPNNDEGKPGTVDDRNLTNNTYRAGTGYYHSGVGMWYPFPYNYYSPGAGYYHNGSWSSTPSGGSAASLASTHSGAKAPTMVRASSASVSRGGFGGSAHSSSSVGA